MTRITTMARWRVDQAERLLRLSPLTTAQLAQNLHLASCSVGNVIRELKHRHGAALAWADEPRPEGHIGRPTRRFWLTRDNA